MLEGENMTQKQYMNNAGMKFNCLVLPSLHNFSFIHPNSSKIEKFEKSLRDKVECCINLFATWSFIHAILVGGQLVITDEHAGPKNKNLLTCLIQ